MRNVKSFLIIYQHVQATRRSVVVILIDHSVQSVEKYSVQEIHTKNIILAIDVYLVSVRHIYLEEKSRKVVDLLCSLKHLLINKKMLCKKKKLEK